MTAWFAGLSTTAKTLWAFGTVFLLGTAVAASGYFTLPAQVEINTAAISRNTTDVTEIKRTLGDILCILTQPAGANPLDCVRP